MTVSATEVKNKLGEYLDRAQTESVIVEKSGRPRAVLMGYEDYKRLSAMEDLYWLQRAHEAEKSGYIGSEATMAVLNEGLSQPDSE